MNSTRLKILFGFALLLLIAGLAFGLIIHHVEEPSSFGLAQIMTILSVLSGAWAQWAFRHDDDDKR